MLPNHCLQARIYQNKPFKPLSSPKAVPICAVALVTLCKQTIIENKNVFSLGGVTSSKKEQKQKCSVNFQKPIFQFLHTSFFTKVLVHFGPQTTLVIQALASKTSPKICNAPSPQTTQGAYTMSLQHVRDARTERKHTVPYVGPIAQKSSRSPKKEAADLPKRSTVGRLADYFATFCTTNP